MGEDVKTASTVPPDAFRLASGVRLRRAAGWVHAWRACPRAHEVTWRGVDDHGVALEAGVYFARLSAGDVGQTRKILLARRGWGLSHSTRIA